MKFKNILAVSLVMSVMFSSTAFADEVKKGNVEKATEIVEQSTENVEQKVEQAKKWTDYFVVSHACGAVDGRAETNSLEAFEQNYAKGQRVFEIDFTLTLDYKLVARHDFEQNSYYVTEQKYDKIAPILTHERFMLMPINYKYTPMDIDKVVELLNKYKDAYIITDSKDTDKETIQREFKIIKEAVEKTGNKEILDRIVVQIYHPEMFSYVKECGEFKNFVLTTYQIKNPDLKELSKFCVENGVAGIVMPSEAITVEKAKTIHDAGLKLYTHTVNRLFDTKNYISMYGIDGIYSDYIIESDIEYIK